VTSLKEVRQLAEADIEAFISLISPETVLGHVHKEFLTFLTSSETKSHRLGLLPRDHQKSRMAAFYVLWRVTKEPWLRVLYLSSTSNLAEKQLKFIKDKLLTKTYARYWPTHVHPEESKRERWTASEISLDHPSRKAEGLRDPTVFTAGLTTSITGLHADIIILDDVVVFDNAYTEEGRDRVNSRVSLIASIEGAESEQVVVGTRYHPKDAYGLMQDMIYDIYDDKGEPIGQDSVYSVFTRTVEEGGDFLWPRQQRPADGKWFGFDWNILNRKKAQYLDRTQFYAQYYNNPNNPEGGSISANRFQYYERKNLERVGGVWFHKQDRLNIAASMDFAFSLDRKADSTSIVVAAMNADCEYLVLDIDRFKTDQISEYFDHLLALYSKWGFKKLRLECTAAQKVIVKDLKQNYIKPKGLLLTIDEFVPTRHMGSKQERINGLLQARYTNGQIWHYRGGHCQTLEDELVLENPPHDDVKEGFANCVDLLRPPAQQANRLRPSSNVIYNTRFGGVA